MFCDKYIADTDLEGGGGAYAIGTGEAGEMPTMIGIIEKIVTEKQAELTLFDDKAGNTPLSLRPETTTLTRRV